MWRAAHSSHRGDPGFKDYLLLWRQVVAELGLEFLPGEPLCNSSLRGRYGGLETRITVHAEEIRVITNFHVELPGPPSDGLLQRLQEIAPQGYYSAHEHLLGIHNAAVQRDRLVNHAAGYRLNSPVDEAARDFERRLGFSRLTLSERRLHCMSRYVNTSADYRDVLSAVGEVARTLTVGVD